MSDLTHNQCARPGCDRCHCHACHLHGLAERNEARAWARYYRELFLEEESNPVKPEGDRPEWLTRC